VIFSAPPSEIQLGRGEPIKDTARVLGRMVHGAVFRTFGQADVEEFAKYGGIPTINALTDEEHPCQILADIFTFQEKHGEIRGKTVTFIGDGACNVANSWRFRGGQAGLWSCAFARAQGVSALAGAAQASWRERHVPGGCDLGRQRHGPALTPMCGVSMGKEAESADRLRALSGYQINAEVVRQAKPGALVMHCLPRLPRGKEITEETLKPTRRRFSTGGKPVACAGRRS